MLRVPCPRGSDPYFASQDRRFALFHGDCLTLMPLLEPASFDMVFADPPYFLSNDGVTCRGGRMASVNKGAWDRSLGFRGNYEFTTAWLRECKRLLTPNGTIWISGTSHIIHIVGCALDELGYKVLNDITWVKINPPPNLSCRYFTHATETIIWAARDKCSHHYFNYRLMKQLNAGKQMTSVWRLGPPGKQEKTHGRHPTQKPLVLLERIVAASTADDACVLDPFSGSGTTAIAAARMGRRAVGLESDQAYLEVATKRYAAHSLNGDTSSLRFMEKQISLSAPPPAQPRLFP